MVDRTRICLEKDWICIIYYFFLACFLILELMGFNYEEIIDDELIMHNWMFA